jgi:hypothetical protein
LIQTWYKLKIQTQKIKRQNDFITAELFSPPVNLVQESLLD